jgi:hypothetical protein
MLCIRCYSTVYVGGEYGYQRGDERPGCYASGLWYEQHNAQPQDSSLGGIMEHVSYEVLPREIE